ncbi:sugar ABC transporter substrate-binding protein [Pseudolysinimonas yzui]|uniref:Sugar ABC transporter substrate-binding protein n=1 Tax=Pseudolysinimonas yzui TaxID=2708254 RepID=A0A8J3GMP8_9MICO|nr:substrate-binding domain-containing protein [Pseudolysinimonas yzui]GHF05434.1 sugar ABC transporter substrate-binding protein [Pseudolysinimonas yzui]
MKRLRLALVAAVAAGALALTGCTTDTGAPDDSGAPAEGGEVGFFSVSSQIPIITTLAESVTEYLGTKGYTVTVYDAGFDPVTQAQQIQQAIDTEAMVAAWVFPVAAEALAPSLDALKAAGIPVVLEADVQSFGFDGPQPGIIFDAASFADFGTALAGAANECATAEGGTETMLLSASAVASGADASHEAILELYTATPIVADAQAADPVTAQTTAAQLLVANPNVDVVIAASDETTLGALAAFQAAGKTPKCLIAGGGGPDTMAAYEAGDIDAVVAWDYAVSLQAAGDDLIELIADPTQLGSINETAIVVSD